MNNYLYIHAGGLKKMTQSHLERHKYHCKNETRIKLGINDALQEISETVKIRTGRRIQMRATPVREAEVLLDMFHRMRDLKYLEKEMKRKFGISVIQTHIHRDHGMHHAHLLINWMDGRNGKSIKLDKYDMSRMQTLVRDCLYGDKRKVTLMDRLYSAVGQVRTSFYPACSEVVPFQGFLGNNVFL